MGSAPHFSARIESHGGVAHISLSGELDLSTAPDLERHLAPFVPDGVSTIMLDLRDLAFTDATGIRAFIAARNRFKISGRRLVLVGATPVVRRMFDMTGTQDLLDDLDVAGVLGRSAASNSHRNGQAVHADADG
jgi:anti-sigma B factor antagonist